MRTGTKGVGIFHALSIHEIILLVYVFLNPFLLPFGLFYTHVYAPISLLYVIKWRSRATLFILLLVLVAIAYSLVFYISSVADIRWLGYLSSTAVLYSGLVFSIYLYVYIGYQLDDFDSLFNRVIIINMIAGVAALILHLVGLGDALWAPPGETDNGYRLRLFFYEPSIYALVQAPFVIYAITRYLEQTGAHSVRYLFFAIFPLMLSASAGVLGATSLAVLLVNLKRVMRFLRKKWLASLALCAVVVMLAPQMISRFQSILAGEDFSGLVRVVFSLQAAINMLQEKAIWLLGVGPGQLKYYIGDYTSEIPGYEGDNLPNSIASTVATVGGVGLAVKLIIMLSLYWSTRSHRYSFSSTVFVFIFIYQFTGGFFNNVNEYAALAIAFGYARYMERRVSVWPSKQNLTVD